MFSENIGNDYIVIQEGTSEGTQVKYKKDGYWYKKKIIEEMKDVLNILFQSLCSLLHFKKMNL